MLEFGQLACWIFLLTHGICRQAQKNEKQTTHSIPPEAGSERWVIDHAFKLRRTSLQIVGTKTFSSLGRARCLYFPAFDLASSSRRRRAQPSLVIWRLRPRTSASGGTSAVMVEPAAT